MSLSEHIISITFAMEGNLRELNIKRGNVRSKLTRFSNHLRDLLIRYPNDTDLPDSKEAVGLEFRLQHTQTLLGEFESIQAEIEFISNKPEESHLATREQFENLYFNALSSAKQILNRDKHTSVRTLSDDQSISSQHDMNINNPIKLPTINLPQFNGQYDQWLEFRDTFDALINNNPNITAIQRFHYLRSALLEDAALLITSFEVSADNYISAWQLLCERFNNNKLLIKNHVKAIFNLNKMPKPNSVQLRRLLDEFNKHLRILSTLHEPVESWDTLLLYIISERLDSSTSTAWEEHTSNIKNTMPKFADLKSFIKNRADFLESIETRRSDTFTVQENKTKHKFNNKRHTFVVTKFECFYCKGDHAIYSCPKFIKLSISQRISEIQKLNLCANCLQRGHKTSDCKRGQCKHCSQRHNSLLHQTPAEKSGANISDDISNTRLNLHCRNSPNVSNVLLSTAIVTINNSNGFKVRCRALLDSASQSNFIAMHCCNKLDARTFNINESIGGLNSSSTKITKGCNLEISSIYNSFKIKSPFLIVPNITGHLPSFPIDISRLSIPSGISLADESFYQPD